MKASKKRRIMALLTGIGIVVLMVVKILQDGLPV
jgi:hypothetical protein